MSTDNDAEDLSAPRRPAVETWREVMDLKLRLAEMARDLKQIAALADDHTKLELRVRALELFQASANQRNTTTLYVWMAVQSLIPIGVMLYTAFIKR